MSFIDDLGETVNYGFRKAIDSKTSSTAERIGAQTAAPQPAVAAGTPTNPAGSPDYRPSEQTLRTIGIVVVLAAIGAIVYALKK